jgi:16S rRNA (cytosine967-C5)-methyltransferase
MKIRSDRLLAVKILKSLVSGSGSLSSLLTQTEQENPGANSALIREFCFGVCRWYPRLDAVASRLLDKPLRSKDSDVHCLILLGLYQLLYMRIPDHAVINETVAVTRELRKDWARGLVNAILRQAQRNKTESSEEVLTETERYAHPAWLIDRLKQDWPQAFSDIMAANNTQAPMTLRLNIQRCDRDKYLEMLSESGVNAHIGSYAPTAVILENPGDVQSLPGFNDGIVSVQDEASQLVAKVIGPRAGQHVLDACAAPGGKTGALFECCTGDLHITALDNQSSRLDRVSENLNRLGYQARLISADAASPETWWDGELFDVILLDAPCSGTGVIRRHPDIKLLRTETDIARLTSLQRHLLDSLWPLLKPGGKFLYSTCSVLRVENTDQVAQFLASTPDALSLPLDLPGTLDCPAGRQFLPQINGVDGFFYALMEKAVV